MQEAAFFHNEISTLKKCRKKDNWVRAIFSLLLILLSVTGTLAHPGSGIVVDSDGQVYFTDTGKGIWKIDTQGRLSFMPSSRFHWLAIDEKGFFANSEKSFGGYFERVTMKGVKPALIICSDFPFTINPDGNIYYADTRENQAKIIRRTPSGKETVLIKDRIFSFISGICSAPDSSLFITEASNAQTNTIRKITLNGKMSNFASFTGHGGTGLKAGTDPSYCRGLEVDPAGFVYVAATGSRSVLKISPHGVVTTLLLEPDPWRPTGIAWFHGELYLLEWQDVAPSLEEERTAWIPRVRKIEKNGEVRTLVTISRN